MGLGGGNAGKGREHGVSCAVWRPLKPHGLRGDGVGREAWVQSDVSRREGTIWGRTASEWGERTGHSLREITARSRTATKERPLSVTEKNGKSRVHICTHPHDVHAHAPRPTVPAAPEVRGRGAAGATREQRGRQRDDSLGRGGPTRGGGVAALVATNRQNQG